MSDDVKNLAPCPFCGAALIHTVEPRTDAPWPLMRYWGHPSSDCWADDVAIDADDPEKIAAWNRRAADPVRGELVKESARILETIRREECVIRSDLDAIRAWLAKASGPPTSSREP